MHEEIRCWTYSALAGVFADLARPTEPPVGRTGVHPRTRRALEALGAAFDGASADDLAADHTRLFVNAAGGVPAPPYAGWYLDGALGGPACGRAAEAYAAQCLEVAGGAGQPPDYVATELEFLHLMCRHQLAARATGDAAALCAARQAEADFLSGHFLLWVPFFARAIREAAPGPVFGRAAEVLECFCAEAGPRLARDPERESGSSAVGAMDRSAHSGRPGARPRPR